MSGLIGGIMIVLIFLFSSFTINAQITFERNYDTLGCYYSNYVQQNIDNGFILCGSSYNPNLAQQAAVVRTDFLGNIIWAKEFGSVMTDGALLCLIDSNANIVVIGLKDGFSSTDSKIWIFILDQYGNIIHDNDYKVLSGANDARSISKCHDGGYIISGTCNTPTVPAKISFLLKIDHVGNVLWSQTYGTGTGNSFFDAMEVFDNGIVGVGDMAVGSIYQLFVVKTDSVGNIIWSDTIGTAPSTVAYSVKQNLDSTLFVAGNIYNSHDMDIFISKFSQTGNWVWTKLLGDSLNNSINCLQHTSDGNYMLAGTTEITGSSDYQILIFKVDQIADTIWVNNYGGSYSEIGFYGIQCNDGGYAVTGQINILQPPHDAMYLIKVDSNGTLTNVSGIPVTVDNFNLFPNPASYGITIQMPEFTYGELTYVVSDISGRTVLSGTAPSSTFSIDVQFLSRGTYLLMLKTKTFRSIKQFLKY